MDRSEFPKEDACGCSDEKGDEEHDTLAVQE